MKIRLLLLLTLFVAACGNTQPQNVVSLHVDLPKDDWSKCTGTVVGPHSILTAGHCPVSKGVLSADDKIILFDKTFEDGNDHQIVRVRGIKFTKWAKITQRELVVGENISFSGFPAGFQRLYRRGYVSGEVPISEFVVPTPVKATKIMLLDANAWVGDSGAGIFDRKGEIVGVITGFKASGALKMTVTYPFAFTPEQLKEALAP